MSVPVNLNLQQTIEGMPLAFQSEAAGDLQATIQFEINGKEPGSYHLVIHKGLCEYHPGQAENANLIIQTPSEIWLSISSGKLDGQEALMQGLYSANGDISLLLKMNDLFNSSEDFSYEAPPDQRPDGPLRIPGMTWMTVAFIPWILHWIFVDMHGVPLFIKIGLPAILSGLIILYRMVYDRPTWMEWGGLAYFGLAVLLNQAAGSRFLAWGSVLSSAAMGVIWMSSLLWSKMPLSGDYSKWGFVKALWKNSLFTYPNAVISLVWGWQFFLATGLGIAAHLLPGATLTLTILRFLLQVPTFIFTFHYQKKVPITNPALSDKTIRLYACIGLILIGLQIAWIVFQILN